MNIICKHYVYYLVTNVNNMNVDVNNQ